MLKKMKPLKEKIENYYIEKEKNLPDTELSKPRPRPYLTKTSGLLFKYIRSWVSTVVSMI